MEIDSSEFIPRIKSYLFDLQNRLCSMLEAEEAGMRFQEDVWQHAEGGGGVTRVMMDGSVIEKSGVNVSHVHGLSLPQAALANRPDCVNRSFQALGLSSVTHPLNPYVPTAHLNVRFICTDLPDGTNQGWFGGGFDLTPYYGFEEDCIDWHNQAREACEPFGPEIYPLFKKNCDKYFYLKHRNEARGIGGLFFDDIRDWGSEKGFLLMQRVGDAFVKVYQRIIARRKTQSFGEHEKAFQEYRRGRYVEFNLLYDRGTLFGLESKGRVESILVSLPPKVAWIYNKPMNPGSPEALLVPQFLTPRDWVKN